MLPECDYVVVAAPLTPDTKHMMSTAEFNCMKPEAIIMNVTSVELKRVAVANGMITLRRSGLQKVRDEVTTIEEVVRETVH